MIDTIAGRYWTLCSIASHIGSQAVEVAKKENRVETSHTPPMCQWRRETSPRWALVIVGAGFTFHRGTRLITGGSAPPEPMHRGS